MERGNVSWVGCMWVSGCVCVGGGGGCKMCVCKMQSIDFFSNFFFFFFFFNQCNERNVIPVRGERHGPKWPNPVFQHCVHAIIILSHVFAVGSV